MTDTTPAVSDAEVEELIRFYQAEAAHHSKNFRAVSAARCRRTAEILRDRQTAEARLETAVEEAYERGVQAGYNAGWASCADADAV